MSANSPWRKFIVAALVLTGALGACGKSVEKGDEKSGHGAPVSADYERGPHNGRMLRDGEFAVEITIFEDGVEPQFRVYPYRMNAALAPTQVQLSMALTRLGGGIDRFAFRVESDFLMGDAVVMEPHSFDVAVRAIEGGATHDWTYQSHEGRTTIAAAQAKAAGVVVEVAGPAAIEETVALSGRIELQPQGRADITAWYPGRIVTMSKAIGDRVQRGDTLARVTSSESLQTYAITSPLSGVVLSRNANVGEVAGASPIYVIADFSRVHAQFQVYPRDAERLRAGQAVTVRNLGGEQSVRTTIASLLPAADMSSQTVMAYAPLPASSGMWRPGQAVEGDAVVASQQVPLAVRTRALQRFRDFTVVFAQVEDTYEVRMLKLGRRTPEWTEVLGGLPAGATYVTDNAFLIRADIEKSGASHDH